MVSLKNGDLLKSNCDVICQQVNCMGVMNSGIARQIKYGTDNVYNEYSLMCSQAKDKRDLLGNAQLVYTGKFFVANLFSQYEYGYNNIHTDYKSFRICLKKLKKILPNNITTIGFPHRIGCGLGGGDWATVESIIIDEFDGTKYDVQIWRLL